MQNKFWNEPLETMAADSLREYETGLLVDQVDYMYRNSDFFHSQFSSVGITPADITCQDDLALLPFTEKKTLAQTQRKGELIGPHQCASQEDIIRIVGTGGTSGQPMRIGWTQNDVEVYSEMGARALWIMGCRPDDLVLNCFNYSIYAGGVMDHMSFEALGASILAYGVGKTRELLELLADLPGNKCLYSTPSYAIRLAEVAMQADIDLLSLNLHKGFFSGEAGLQVPGYRDRIETLWGMSSHDLYGIAELGCQSAECEFREGMHFCGAGLVIAELIDPDSGEIKSMTDGETGELVFTSIKREASPMLRLRSHDYVQIFTQPCQCGRRSFRFRTLGRSDDMFVVKGVNIFPTGIQEIVTRLRPQLTGEFQIVLDRAPPFDYSPRLIVEVDKSVAKLEYTSLISQVEDVIKRQLGFTSAVELVEQGTIASEHKTRRVLRLYENH